MSDEPESIPRILPVLDLMGGQVVRGVAGNRESYQPLRSPLCNGCRPIDVANALRDLVGHDWLYVADLDAIQSAALQETVLEELIAEGFRLIVDAGINGPSSAEQLVNRGVARVVVALETLSDRRQLPTVVSAVGRERTVFSLDLKDGRPLARPGVFDDLDPQTIANWAIEQGIGGLIVLDLSGVGVDQGVPTANLCRVLSTEYPDLTLITGGGVRNAEDVSGLLVNGVDGVLVSSALHRQTITADDLRAFL